MTVWDLTNPGHGIIDYAFEPIDGGQRATLTVWRLFGSRFPEIGDAMIIRHHKRDPLSETARYRVTQVRRCADPQQMAFLDLTFWPRTAEEKREAVEGRV